MAKKKEAKWRVNPREPGAPEVPGLLCLKRCSPTGRDFPAGSLLPGLLPQPCPNLALSGSESLPEGGSGFSRLVTAPLPASADSIRTTSRIMLLAAACGSTPERETAFTRFPRGLWPGTGVTSAAAPECRGTRPEGWAGPKSKSKPMRAGRACKGAWL